MRVTVGIRLFFYKPPLLNIHKVHSWRADNEIDFITIMENARKHHTVSQYPMI